VLAATRRWPAWRIRVVPRIMAHLLGVVPAEDRGNGGGLGDSGDLDASLSGDLVGVEGRCLSPLSPNTGGGEGKAVKEGGGGGGDSTGKRKRLEPGSLSKDGGGSRRRR